MCVRLVDYIVSRVDIVISTRLIDKWIDFIIGCLAVDQICC